ncbi:hypothetical protein B0H14DRAFT_2577134 [Mycena olivaceomarginata]|nr:hypothetical protein B0H14DRAFT_2577134 [Mycena olivaceomarginata]
MRVKKCQVYHGASDLLPVNRGQATTAAISVTLFILAVAGDKPPLPQFHQLRRVVDRRCVTRVVIGRSVNLLLLLASKVSSLKMKIAEHCADMFPHNDKGNFEAIIPMVALTCAAFYSTLDDWTTGATDFEGKWVQEIYDIHVVASCKSAECSVKVAIVLKYSSKALAIGHNPCKCSARVSQLAPNIFNCGIWVFLMGMGTGQVWGRLLRV